MKKINLFLSALIIGISANAQDIHFSQMIYSPHTLNPALVGANYDMEAIINYKSQWQSVASPYKTMAASFDARFTKNHHKKTILAGGLNFFNDVAGDAKVASTNANFTIACHTHINDKSTFGGALQIGYGQRAINNPAGLQWSSQFDGVNYNAALPSNETFNNQKFGYFDTGLGLVYKYQKSERYMTGNDQRSVIAGFSVYHLNQPKYSFLSSSNDKLQIRMSGFVTALIGMGNTRLSLVPGIYYNRQGPTQEFLVGTYFKTLLKEQSKYTRLMQATALSFGTFLRAKDAMILKLMLERGSYSAGFSYDVNVSSLAAASKRKGGFEIFIRFTTPSPFSQSKSRI